MIKDIAILLPYKENYTFSKASAASLWVSEFFKKSKFKENNFIFGHTKGKDYLSRNYINIDLKNIKDEGIFFIPTDHFGNSQRSDEEAEIVHDYYSKIIKKDGENLSVNTIDYYIENNTIKLTVYNFADGDKFYIIK